MNNLQVADFVAETGDLSIKAFQTCFTSSWTVKILFWLDTLGIVERRGRGRFLNCSLPEAVKIIKNTPWESHKKKTGPKEGLRMGICNNSLRFFVENDPSGYFGEGANWPAIQVWGKGRDELPEKGEFAIGTRLKLQRGNEAVGLFEMKKTGFVQI